MELELKFTEVTGCEPVGDLVTTQEESMETAIPEYCPDMARIVDTVGQLRLREKHLTGQQLTVSGSVVLTVLSLGTRVALAYALAGPVGESGIWWAIVAAIIFQGLLAAWWFERGTWSRKTV